MRVGVVGCGYWGAKHVRVLSQIPAVTQVTAIDPDPGRRGAMTALHPHVVGAESLSDALPSVDALVIATPARTHAALARSALCASKHVLVEKPMATSVGDAADLAELATRHEVTLMVGHTFEHHQAVHALREVIDSGEVGSLLHVTSTRLNLGLYQRDVNVVWDLAPHDVSILNYLVHDVPEEISCWGFKNVSSEVEDIAQLALRYASGVTASVQVSWLHPEKVRAVTAVGTDGMVVYDDVAPGHPVRVIDKGARDGGPAEHIRYWQGEERTPTVGTAEALVSEDEHFVHCAMTGRQPRTDSTNGLAVTATIEAAQRSLSEHRPVALTEVLDRHLLRPASAPMSPQPAGAGMDR